MNTRASIAQTEWEPFKLESRQAAAPIVRLWLLRMLVPLGAHKEFIAGVAERCKMTTELLYLLTHILDLEHWIELKESDEFDIKSTLNELNKLHREAVKLHRAAKKAQAEDWIIQALGLEHWIGGEFDKKSALKELIELHRAAEKEPKSTEVPPGPLANKIKQATTRAWFSNIDCRIFECAALLHAEPSLMHVIASFAPLNELRNHQDVVSVLSTLLALPQDEICLSLEKNSGLTNFLTDMFV